MHDQRLGTAEWSDPEEFSRQHAFKEGMFWLGRSPVTGDPLGYADDRHVCLISGTRGGKGTTSIIPNLCAWPGSIVVVDPKGENATATAARRGNGSDFCAGMYQKVHVLDPFIAAQVDSGYRSSFNPLDELDADNPSTIDEAGRIADAIVVVNPESRDPFWDQSARSLVKGLILHVITDPFFEGRRNLVTVRHLITRGDHEGVALLQQSGEADIASAQALLWQAVATNQSFNGVLAGIGESMLNMAMHSAKQFESVLQVANRNTEFLDSPGMQLCVSSSSFRIAELKTDPAGVSIYLSLPQRYMGEHFRWIRMMITLVLNEMEAVSGDPAAGHPVLLCLDEFAGLKRMEVIENATAQIAGFGVKLLFVLQSLEQLKAVYKDNWETFLANAGLKLVFGVEDQFTRKYISDLIGETELIRRLETASETEGTSESTSEGSSVSRSSSQTTSRSQGHSETHGSSSSFGSSASRSNSMSLGTGESSSHSDSWKSMPFFMRDTAGVFRALSGSRQASSGYGQSSSRSITGGTSDSISSTDGTSESKSSSSTESASTGLSESASRSVSDTRGRTTGSTRGVNESLNKRPLITPDEVGRYFGRGDPTSTPFGLVLAAHGSPAIVQRPSYFNDNYFIGRFDPLPNHPPPEKFITKTIKLVDVDGGENPFRLMCSNYDIGGDPDGQILSLSPLHPRIESLNVTEGEAVEQGQVLGAIGVPYIGTYGDRRPAEYGLLKIRAPFRGTIEKIHHPAGSSMMDRRTILDIRVSVADIAQQSTVPVRDEIREFHRAEHPLWNALREHEYEVRKILSAAHEARRREEQLRGEQQQARQRELQEHEDKKRSIQAEIDSLKHKRAHRAKKTFNVLIGIIAALVVVVILMLVVK